MRDGKQERAASLEGVTRDPRREKGAQLQTEGSLHTRPKVLDQASANPLQTMGHFREAGPQYISGVPLPARSAEETSSFA